MLDETGLGGGAAHVETQQPLLAEASGVPAAGERAGCRAGLDEADRSACRIVGGHHATVGQHHQHGAAEALGGQPRLQLVEVRADHRHRRRVARRRHHPRVLAQLRRHVGGDAHRHAELAAQMVGDAPLVGAVDIGVEQTDADRLDLSLTQRRRQRGEIGIARHLMDHPARQHPLGDLERQLARDRRRRELDLQVVHVVAMLIADQQRVAEPLRGHQTGATRLALDQRVGHQGRGMHDRRRDLRWADLGVAEQLGDSLTHTIERLRRRRQHLLDDHRARAGIDQHDIGERPPDVDREAQIASHDRSARGGAKTSRIQHSPYSSSPMNTESPCHTSLGAR